MSTPSGQRAPLSQFLSDSVLFGFGGMADRVIGFLFLPITASILGSSGFGVYNLYATTSAILFLLCAVGMHSAYFRFATDEAVTRDGLPVLNVALVVIHAVSAIWIPIAALNAGVLADWLIGVPEPWFIYLLCLRTYSDIVGSLVDCKLQADGRIKLFLWLRVPATAFVRTISLLVLVRYRTPLAYAAGEAIAAALVTLPIAAYVLREARLRVDRALAFAMIRYGAAMVPGMVAAWLLVAASRYLLRAFGPDQIRDVGLFSLAERFSSVVLLLGQTLWLGWRRFAFRNMHLPEGPQLLAEGLTIYFTAAAFGTVAIAILGPATIHVLINAEFAPAAVLVAPLTFSAFASVFAFPLRMGLIKNNQSMTMSLITIAVAIVTIGLALLWIPEYASAGAVAASLVGQIVGLVLTWQISQRVYHVPIETRRLALLTLWFAAAYGLCRLIEPFGWTTTLIASSVLLTATPYLIYRFGPLSRQERERIAAGAAPWLERLRG